MWKTNLECRLIKFLPLLKIPIQHTMAKKCIEQFQIDQKFIWALSYYYDRTLLDTPSYRKETFVRRHKSDRSSTKMHHGSFIKSKWTTVRGFKKGSGERADKRIAGLTGECIFHSINRLFIFRYDAKTMVTVTLPKKKGFLQAFLRIFLLPRSFIKSTSSFLYILTYVTCKRSIDYHIKYL